MEKRSVTLALTGDQHTKLRGFLFPGDGFEAVAFLLCGQRDGDRRRRLVVQEVHVVPYDQCPVRSEVQVVWATDFLASLLDRAADKGLSVVKVHSHPTGYPTFSQVDDESDAQLLPMVEGWVEREVVHGSAVMLPDGKMFGRYLELTDESLQPIDCIAVANDDIAFWNAGGSASVPGFLASQAQAFDEGTIQRLRGLSVAVVGCSGTGSPVVEQLARLGVGELVLVDEDMMEDRNVNRILNSTMADAAISKPKVEVLRDAVEQMGLGTRVVAVARNLFSAEAVKEVAQCDIVFGCMDTVDGRYLLNVLSTYYNIPYFDVGIRLVAKEGGGVQEVCGSVHYLVPGRSSMMSRGVFTMEQVAAAGLRRNDPAAHEQQLDDGYIKGVVGRRPAVVTPNMFAASLAVNELLSRLHPYRYEANENYAHVEFTLAGMELDCYPDGDICGMLSGFVGRGDVTPMLRMPELSESY